MIELCFQLGLIAALTIVGPVVVLTRDPPAQVVAFTFYGLLLGLLFLAFQAPDVALAQFVIGSVALPILVLLTLARMHRHRRKDDKAPKRLEESRA